MNDLQEQLPCPRVKNEDGAINRLRGQVAFERLVDCDAVYIGVVHEPDDLVREQLAVVL